MIVLLTRYATLFCFLPGRSLGDEKWVGKESPSICILLSHTLFIIINNGRTGRERLYQPTCQLLFIYFLFPNYFYFYFFYFLCLFYFFFVFVWLVSVSILFSFSRHLCLRLVSLIHFTFRVRVSPSCSPRSRLHLPL